MPGFTKNAFGTPFGRNVFLRSTQDVKTVSWTVAKDTVPSVTIDGNQGQKVLQPGTVMAKITSGPDTGKIGPFQAAGTDEVQVLTPGGTISGGTYTITVLGATTAPIAYNANAATIQAAVRAAVAALTGTDDATVALKLIGDGITVTGGPISSGAVTLTFNAETSQNVAQATVDTALLTGAAPTLTPSTTTAGVAGATDGRETLANIVGICNTFLPWQLMDRDVEVAVIYEASVVQANCIELNTAGASIALTNTTAAGMFALKSLDIKFF